MLLHLRRKRIGAGGLPYADEVNFHLDSLPSLAEEESFFVRTLRMRDVPEVAGPGAQSPSRTSGIRPTRSVTTLWLTSNPRGLRPVASV